MDKIHLQLLFVSHPYEVYAIVMKAGKQLKKHYEGLEEWKQAYVTAAHK